MPNEDVRFVQTAVKPLQLYILDNDPSYAFTNSLVFQQGFIFALIISIILHLNHIQVTQQPLLLSLTLLRLY